jgi:NAD(P)-dependent dehydrogenase (short-subunit alcohol dehydrogenase family)
LTRVFDLTGRVGVVTGALGRLGPVWIEALLEAGASVLGVDLPSAKTSDAFVALEDTYGRRRLRLTHADVVDRTALSEARAFCVAELGPADVLVNNAGIDSPPVAGRSWRLEDIPWETSLPVLETNVGGVFQVSQVFGGDMAARRRGSIVNIGSLYASVSPDARFYDHIESDPPFLKAPAYGASKAAVVNLTKYLATHWGPYGVRVNALSPGGVRGGQDPEFQRKFCDRVPMRRMAELEDLGGPLLFLASDASRYVTGIELRVDGGFTAW